MDKKFWLAMRENQYAIPEGYTIENLMEELLEGIGSVDPEIRDIICYETYANWLAQGKISPELVRAYISRMLENLSHGLGEKDTNTIFLRSFSALLLAETVHHNNKNPFLEKNEINNLLSQTIAYLQTERDPRGYVDEKGWAHALAHTADLLYTLASNRLVESSELEQILYTITSKLTEPTDWVYRHGEDDRLMQTAAGVVQRNLLDENSYTAWLTSCLEPSWKGSYEDQSRNNAFFNTRNFLRGFYLFLLELKDLPIRDFLFKETGDTLRKFRQF
jgi:hypothetical protein